MLSLMDRRETEELAPLDKIKLSSQKITTPSNSHHLFPPLLVILPDSRCHEAVLIFWGKKRIMETAFQEGKEEVISAWYMDDSKEDQRLSHHRNPEQFVSLDKLSELGILSWRLDADNYETDENLKKIREARGYSYVDICDVCPEKLPNYEAKIKNFFEEHLHTDEEIRYCLEGSGYFDVRDKNDEWIRIAVRKGGMIVLPAGMYHRFTLDTDNYIKAMRLFVGDPIWTPFNRPHDHLPARKEYLEAVLKKGVEAN
ncbi:hypothetical protein LUZ60_005858 [Juncus effusus]|nr:hypothetical protein LUZ60_005858 [Juncus effusus]